MHFCNNKILKFISWVCIYYLYHCYCQASVISRHFFTLVEAIGKNCQMLGTAITNKLF